MVAIIAPERLARLQGSKISLRWLKLTKPKITQPASAGQDTLSPSITKVFGEVLKDRKEGRNYPSHLGCTHREDRREAGGWGWWVVWRPRGTHCLLGAELYAPLRRNRIREFHAVWKGGAVARAGRGKSSAFCFFFFFSK